MKKIYCKQCKEETEHDDFGIDIPMRVRFKCVLCDSSNSPEDVLVEFDKWSKTNSPKKTNIDNSRKKLKENGQ